MKRKIKNSKKNFNSNDCIPVSAHCAPYRRRLQHSHTHPAVVVVVVEVVEVVVVVIM
jgi:hypothetical protein